MRNSKRARREPSCLGGITGARELDARLESSDSEADRAASPARRRAPAAAADAADAAASGAAHDNAATVGAAAAAAAAGAGAAATAAAAAVAAPPPRATRAELAVLLERALVEGPLARELARFETGAAAIRTPLLARGDLGALATALRLPDARLGCAWRALAKGTSGESLPGGQLVQACIASALSAHRGAYPEGAASARTGEAAARARFELTARELRSWTAPARASCGSRTCTRRCGASTATAQALTRGAQPDAPGAHETAPQPPSAARRRSRRSRRRAWTPPPP
jgi:hypothetical protein